VRVGTRAGGLGGTSGLSGWGRSGTQGAGPSGSHPDKQKKRSADKIILKIAINLAKIPGKSAFFDKLAERYLKIFAIS
jgi:hypothetical protein